MSQCDSDAFITTTTKTSNLAAFQSLLARHYRASVPAPTWQSVNAAGVVVGGGGGANTKKRQVSYHGRGRGRGQRQQKARLQSEEEEDGMPCASRVGDVLDMAIPEVAPLSETQLAVLKTVQAGTNVFVSGRAGSGKSKVIHVLVQAVRAAGNQIVVTAASGIAAGQVNGVTLHSLCCLGIDGSKTPAESVRAATAKHRVLLQSLRVLVIDEVSMLSSETLEAAFYVIRSVRKGTLPQIVLVGDFCQLPPSGRGTHALESPVWKGLQLKIVLLTSAFRQADSMFVKLLDEVRVGSLSDASLTALQSRVGVVFSGSVRPTTLTSLRSVADAINDKELAKLDTPQKSFTGKVMLATFDAATGCWAATPGGTDVPPKTKAGAYSPYTVLGGLEVSLPPDDTAVWQDACVLVNNSRQPPCLTLAVGAQVLWTANISAHISNGTRGIVKRFEGPVQYPVVELVTGEEVTVTPFSCTKRYGAGAAAQSHVRARKPAGTDAAVSYVYQQLPLQLGWAMTIHKSQGMSIDRAEIDLGEHVFSKGQAYVALSRLRSFEGLALLSFSKTALKTDDRVVAWYRHQEAVAATASKAAQGDDDDDAGVYADADD